ncbi:hypothetical protein ALC62_06392 [Cyphomyrmex costatus]|uniref:Uncharacterized protein n=1 Tax=Cyphomyrmex costatus TaxID=456900 RepID=A0A195CRS7_9HYME|nr:hypothetical protein ALC62_06392 [Cyphomyrmex costatus]
MQRVRGLCRCDVRRKLGGDSQAGAGRGDKIAEGGNSGGSASGKRRKLMHSLCKIAEAHEANSSRAARNQNSSMATAYTILSSPLCQASTYITTSVTYVLDRIESGIEAVNTLLTLTTLIHNNGAAGIEFMVY